MMYNHAIEAQTVADVIGEGSARRNNQAPASHFRTMDAQEYPLIRITENDISDANRLSLSCPICGNAVENHTDGADFVPVVCDKCGTLYHKACWDQSGGKCAVLGCGSEKFHVHGKDTTPVLKIKHTDLAPPSINGRPSASARNRRLKEEQRRQVQNMTLFQRFWRWLFDQIKINP